jgi:hypothetical protein
MITLNATKPVLPVTEAMIAAGLRQHPMPPETMRSILENALRYAQIPPSLANS